MTRRRGPRFKYVPPKKAGASWTTCITLNNTSTSAGSHRTKADAARAVDALLFHHGKPAVNFPGEEEATRAAFPDIGEKRVRRAAARPEAAPAPEGAARGEETGAEATDAERLPGRLRLPAFGRRHGLEDGRRRPRHQGPHRPRDGARGGHLLRRRARVAPRAARLNFPDGWPGDGSAYAGVSRNADAVTTTRALRARHDGRELGSFGRRSGGSPQRVYDFARRCRASPSSISMGAEIMERRSATCEDWESRAVAERDEKSLIEKYGRRFFEDPDRPGEVYYVVHTGVQWTDTGMPAVKVDVVEPARHEGSRRPGPSWPGPARVWM